MGVQDNRRAIVALAKKYGFVLHREAKHYVFKHASGKTLVTSKSTVHRRSLKDVERDIKRTLAS